MTKYSAQAAGPSGGSVEAPSKVDGIDLDVRLANLASMGAVRVRVRAHMRDRFLLGAVTAESGAVGGAPAVRAKDDNVAAILASGTSLSGLRDPKPGHVASFGGAVPGVSLESQRCEKLIGRDPGRRRWGNRFEKNFRARPPNLGSRGRPSTKNGEKGAIVIALLAGRENDAEREKQAETRR